MSENFITSKQEQKQWFVLRDLKRSNAKLPAYKELQNKSIKVFTPMKWRVVLKRGKRMREEIPVIQDLLFAYEVRSKLDLVIEKIKTLQYRYQYGAYCEPIVVNNLEMERFIWAVHSAENPCYYLPDELTPNMYGREVRIIGGPLDNYEGRLLSVRGSKVKRVLVELQGYLSVGVEVNPEYIQFL